MELGILKQEEKQMNFIMFIITAFLPLPAFGFVMLFLQGTMVDISVFSITAFSVLVRIFEKQFGKYAKYFYTSIFAVGGAITIIVGNDGKFGAITQVLVFVLITTIAYYDVSVIKVNAVVTIGINLIGVILFPEAYYKMHNLPIWIFIMIVYAMSAAVAYIISKRAYHMFEVLADKEKQQADFMGEVKGAFDNLHQSSETIYSSLSSFKAISKEIGVSTEEISKSTESQRKEVDSSLAVCNHLAERIAESENRVEETVTTMLGLKKKNDEGIISVTELSQKFQESIASNNQAVEEIETLSQKSTLIGGIVDSIHQIAQQTNLLALNAAIEAARAGESGKGFAVVADEINVLSTQSNQATQKIDEILKDILSTVNRVSELMTQNNEAVNATHEKLNDAVDIFHTMLDSSEDVIKVTYILEEELKNIVTIKEQLLSSMAELNRVSEQSAASTEEINVATKEQVAAITIFVQSMEVVQSGIEQLAAILHSKKIEEDM